MADKTVVKVYPANGSLDQLRDSCQADEDAFQARLTGLERVEAQDETKGTQTTYTRVPFSEVYVTKQLTFVDLANPAPQPPGTDKVFDNADVYLNGAEAQLAVYREQ